ncbi:MAG TPA: hypothetical protein VGZ73_26720 [Bryobacteraceae bacterium]|nr:hypothetical protein [Bryobacteraceae bacterium]
MTKNRLATGFWAIACAWLTCGSVAQEPYAQLRSTGPQSLIIAYRSNPDQRPALRRLMAASGVARFEDWKKQGILRDYHILFNSYLDSETYDMLALLTFRQYSDVSKWREIEKEMPGGLSSDTLKLITSAVTYAADAVRQGSSAETPERGQSTYFIIPYDYLVSTDEYVKYLDTYVIPQVKGWIEADVLAGYTIYLGRYATSRPWSSLFVLEYRSAEAFGRREATVAKVREKLRANAQWRAASENKQKVRVEKQTIVAEELVAK